MGAGGKTRVQIDERVDMKHESSAHKRADLPRYAKIRYAISDEKT